MENKVIVIGYNNLTCVFEKDINNKVEKIGSLEEVIEFKINNTYQEIDNIKLLTKERGVIPPNFYKKHK